MSGSRSGLLSVLRADAVNAVVDQSALITNTRELIEKGMLNRVFDSVPNLLDAELMKKLGEQYIHLLSNARLSGEHDLTPNLATRLALEKWTKTIIDIAITELLDESGKVRDDIVRYFGWSDLRQTLRTKEILSAYLGAVVMQVTKTNEALIIESYSNVHRGICDFQNKNYPGWIDAMMAKKKGFQVSTTTVIAGTAGIVGGVGVVGALIVVGLFASAVSGAPVAEVAHPSNRFT